MYKVGDLLKITNYSSSAPSSMVGHELQVVKIEMFPEDFFEGVTVFMQRVNHQGRPDGLTITMPARELDKFGKKLPKRQELSY